MSTQRIRLRGGTAAQMAAANPILAEREPGVEYDTHVLKVGDGLTQWSSLPALGGGGGGGLTAEDVRDTIAAALVAGANVTITPDDPLDTITIAVTGVQPLDSDLTTIAGLTATTDNVIQSVSNAWASRTPAQLKATLALTKSDVGLENVTNNAQYFAGGTDVALADGGTGASLTDPNADRIMFWDDSAGFVDWLTAGTNLTITGTTINATDTNTLGPDGDKGDITVGGTGTTLTVDNDAITYAKIQNVSATDKLLGRSTAGAGDIEEITCTAAGRALIDDADAAAMRATLGLTRSVYNASVAAQGAGFATDTYLTGSSIAIPASSLQAKTLYRCVFNVTKTAAGVATPIINIRFGTNGTTADTSRGTLTFSAQTAVADEGVFEVWATFRTVGSGTSAVLQTAGRITHGLSITGLDTLVSETEIATSAGFDSTVASSIIGLSVNGGTSAAWTVSLVQAELVNLL